VEEAIEWEDITDDEAAFMQDMNLLDEEAQNEMTLALDQEIHGRHGTNQQRPRWNARGARPEARQRDQPAIPELEWGRLGDRANPNETHRQSEPLVQEERVLAEATRRHRANLAQLDELRVRRRAEMLDWGRQRPLPNLPDRTERGLTSNGASQIHRTRSTPESSRGQREGPSHTPANLFGNPAVADSFSFVPVNPSPLGSRQEQQPTGSSNSASNVLPPRGNARGHVLQQAFRPPFSPSEVENRPMWREQGQIPRSTMPSAIRERNLRHRRAQLRYP
jgi:hypothetical protein